MFIRFLIELVDIALFRHCQPTASSRRERIARQKQIHKVA